MLIHVFVSLRLELPRTPGICPAQALKLGRIPTTKWRVATLPQRRYCTVRGASRFLFIVFFCFPLDALVQLRQAGGDLQLFGKYQGVSVAVLLPDHAAESATATAAFDTSRIIGQVSGI